MVSRASRARCRRATAVSMPLSPNGSGSCSSLGVRKRCAASASRTPGLGHTPGGRTRPSQRFPLRRAERMYGGDVQGEGDVPRARPVRAVQSRLGRSPDPTCTEAGRGKQIETQGNPSSDVESPACRRVAVLARPQTDRAPEATGGTPKLRLFFRGWKKPEAIPIAYARGFPFGRPDDPTLDRRARKAGPGGEIPPELICTSCTEPRTGALPRPDDPHERERNRPLVPARGTAAR